MMAEMKKRKLNRSPHTLKNKDSTKKSHLSSRFDLQMNRALTEDESRISYASLKTSLAKSINPEF